MLIIPISDDNDEGHAWHHHDFVHYGLIFFCIIVFGYEIYLLIEGGIPHLQHWVDVWCFDPRVLGSRFLTLSFGERTLALAQYLAHVDNLGIFRMLAGSFIHGGIMHLVSNMLVLWMLGDNVEYAMGHFRYLLFFLFAAIVSDCGDVIFATAETFRGGIGASGAIMAVAGAYMFYFPKAKINFFYFFFIIWWGTFAVPARLVIGVYIMAQMAIAFHDYGSNYGNVGVWAHVTGFVLGFALAWPLRKDRSKPLEQPRTREAYRSSLRAKLRERRESGDPWGGS